MFVFFSSFDFNSIRSKHLFKWHILYRTRIVRATLLCIYVIHTHIQRQTNKQNNFLGYFPFFGVYPCASVYAQAHTQRDTRTEYGYAFIRRIVKKNSMSNDISNSTTAAAAAPPPTFHTLPILSLSLTHSFYILMLHQPDTELIVCTFKYYYIETSQPTHTQRERHRERAAFSELVCTSCRHILTLYSVPPVPFSPFATVSI